MRGSGAIPKRAGAFWLFLLCCACPLMGCGDSVKLYPVEGKVILDSKPLQGGKIVLSPDRTKGNQAPTEFFGEVSPEGTFFIESERGKGAPAGSYKVMIVEPFPTSKNEGIKIDIPKKYREAGTSGLQIEVGDKKTPGAYDLELKSET